MQSSWWMWNQKGSPTRWNLRQELTLQSWGKISFSSKKPQVLLFRPLLTGRGHHSIEGDLLYFSSEDDVNHIHRIPSQPHLDECLVEPLETGLGKLTQKPDYQSFYQIFSPWKVLTFMLLLLCFAVHFGLHWMKSVRKISEAYWCYIQRESRKKKNVFERY